MNIIPCVFDLCELSEHPAVQVRHQRVTSAPDAPHRVVAHWGTGQSGHVLLTYEDAPMTLTPHDAALLACAITAGGMWTPAFSPGSGASAIAVSLGAAAEVLSYVDPDSEIFGFGRGQLDMSVRNVVAEFFEGACA